VPDVSVPDGEQRGTRADIAALVAEARRAGVAAELGWDGPDTADTEPRIRQALHRVVREALTNVLKHAAGAPTRVEVVHTGDRIEVSVTNEAPAAPGRPMAGNRSGLAGLEERVTLVGGSFTAGPVDTAPQGVGAQRHNAAGHSATAGTVVTTGPGGTAGGTGRPSPVGRPASAGGGSGQPGFRTAAMLPARSGHPLHPDAAHAPGMPPGLSAEALTWPRVLGAGCAAAVVLLPSLLFLVVLLAIQVLR
jgi:hypothetical protein